MIRRTLPQRRAAETFGMRFWNQPFTVTVGFYADGTPGEVFIDGGKTGRDIESTARDAAVVLSLALQHGTAIETIRHAVTRNGSGEAASIVGAIVDAFSKFPPTRKARAMGEHQDAVEFLASASPRRGVGAEGNRAGGKHRDDDREMPAGYPGRDDAHSLCGEIRSDVSQSKPRGPS